jgi:hypothetical protein
MNLSYALNHGYLRERLKYIRARIEWEAFVAADRAKIEARNAAGRARRMIDARTAFLSRRFLWRSP